jgi:hypothetical protein
VRLANRYAIAGLVCVALAMVGAFALVADVVFSDTFAALAAGIAASACAWCWYAQPLLRRRDLHARWEAEAPHGLRPPEEVRGAPSRPGGDHVRAHDASSRVVS